MDLKYLNIIFYYLSKKINIIFYLGVTYSFNFYYKNVTFNR